MKWYEGLDEAMKHIAQAGGFVTVRDSRGRANTMTASWCFAGYLWNMPQLIIAVRPERYTWELLRNSDSFTMSVPFGSLSEELKICGRQSGKNIDKAAVVDFAPAKAISSPIVVGCDIYYECKIHYSDRLEGEHIPAFINERHYNGVWHDLFFGEIVEVYTKF